MSNLTPSDPAYAPGHILQPTSALMYPRSDYGPPERLYAAPGQIIPGAIPGQPPPGSTIIRRVEAHPMVPKQSQELAPNTISRPLMTSPTTKFLPYAPSSGTGDVVGVLKEKVSLLLNENEKLNAALEVSHARSGYDNDPAKIQAMKDKVVRLVEELEQLNLVLERKGDEVNRLNNQLRDKEDEVNRLRRELNEERSRRERDDDESRKRTQAERENDDLKRQVQNLLASLSAKDQENKRLQNELANERGKGDRDIADSERRRQQAEAEAQRLRNHCADLEDELARRPSEKPSGENPERIQFMQALLGSEIERLHLVKAELLYEVEAILRENDELRAELGRGGSYVNGSFAAQG
eukprot:TRINITY_DN2482_c0_g2_i3.p1 TRINITY_DN2482_c0_g2~~TRINITY_DN2482_c0_g2_i3.p1  ORF type:complete len:353 (-),score=52.27 TRINITY_DN2482_c0_g2_i3:64-1122(-)